MDALVALFNVSKSINGDSTDFKEFSKKASIDHLNRTLLIQESQIAKRQKLGLDDILQVSHYLDNDNYL